MSAGRRGFVLALAFFVAALALCPRAGAQPIRVQPNDPNVGKHTIWTGQLTPDQIREFLKQHFQNGEKNPELENLLRQQMAKQKNLNQKEVDEALKNLLNNKELMDRLKDLAQKQQNQFPNNNNGAPPKLNPDDIERLKKLFGNDPFKVPPKVNPVDPVDPVNPPKVNPADPPKFPPFDPKVQPPPPPFDPPQPPPFDPNNPFGNAKNNNGEQLAKQKAAEAAKALWEKNVGPLDDSPEVKRAILDLLNDPDVMNAFAGDDGKNLFDFFKENDANDLKDLFKDLDGWDWPKLDLDFNWNWKGPDWNLGNNAPNVNWNAPRAPRWNWGGGSGFNFGGFSVPVWLVVAILVAIALAVVWWKRDLIFVPRKAGPLVAGGVGGWPLDPRAINSREDVVRAFEYLSVLICGPGAKTWTHSTIADELTVLAQTQGETAVKLARLYELARYAPLDEPLTRAELVEARRLVCDLAGMDEA
jgi:hypothetical protein